MTLFLILCLLFGPGTVWAQEVHARDLPGSAEITPFKSASDLPGLDQKISINLKDTNLVDVLKFLSDKSGVNIVAAKGVEGRVTLSLKEVTIRNALHIVLLSNNLAYRQQDNILLVMTEQDYTSLYGMAYRDQRKVRVIPLTYAKPSVVATFLGSVKSTVGQVIVDEGTGTLVLIDISEKLSLMQRVIARLDIASVVRQTPLTTEVFELKYAKVDDIKTQLSEAITPAGKIQVDSVSNTLIVSDVPSRFSYLKQVMRAFDRKIRQVFIDTKLIQVRLENKYFMGVEWESLQPSTKEFRDLDFKTSFPISTSATSLGKFSIGNLSRDNFTVLVNALKQFGQTETIAGPKLAVVSGQEATILIGTKEAYVTSTVSQAQSTTTTSEDVTFIDVGVQLKVKPEINRDGYIRLTLTPELSSVGRTLTTANKNQIPIVDTTQATTTVLVKDGYTVIMGGLMKDEIKKTQKTIPWLGDIPFIGSAFRDLDDDRIKTELVVLVTPTIITGDEENPLLTASGKKFFPLRDFPQSVTQTNEKRGKEREKKPA